MARILILYASEEGQTAKIVAQLATALRELGYTVDMLELSLPGCEGTLDTCDAVIVGAPIHVGHYPEPIRRFIVDHRQRLSELPGAFFSVSLSAASSRPETREAVHSLHQQFLAECGWGPRLTAEFGGALKYSQYGLAKRLLMRWISSREGGDTDTSRDYEYTDWKAVSHFAREFAATLA
ncbi:MAG: flavodoxin domain-containing protein [Candidatus Competibacterales bacterium]|nr:flavodoxin domain-containing protein [Candidatus Competibacterales bacterium]